MIMVFVNSGSGNIESHYVFVLTCWPWWVYSNEARHLGFIFYLIVLELGVAFIFLC